MNSHLKILMKAHLNIDSHLLRAQIEYPNSLNMSVQKS